MPHPHAPRWVIAAAEAAAAALAAYEAVERAEPLVDLAAFERVERHAVRAAEAADAAAEALCQLEGERHARRADAHRRSARRLALDALTSR